MRLGAEVRSVKLTLVSNTLSSFPPQSQFKVKVTLLVPKLLL